MVRAHKIQLERFKEEGIFFNAQMDAAQMGLGQLRKVNIIKSDIQKPVENIVHIIQIIKLTVQCRCRHCHVIFKVFQHRQFVVNCFFSMMGTNANALAAVDAAFFYNRCFAIFHADRLSRAALYAGGTAAAALRI